MTCWQFEPGSCRQHLAKMCSRWAVAMLFSIAFIMSRHTAHADAMKLSSSQPGNLWIDGQSERFSSPLPDGIIPALARVTDYWGREVYNEPAIVSAKGLTVSLPRLQPGWYTLTLTTAKTSTHCTFGIVLQADKTPGSHDGSVCADAAAAWQLEQSQYGQFADVVKAIGLPMVRERIWWNDVEPRQGVFTWGRYENLINAYSARGIAVDEVWHDTPEWAKARPGSGTSIPPRLEALRGFCLEAAKHYSGKVGAWEVWNEPDNNGIFFNGTAREFYDVMTEAYKALKEGSGGKATVLQGAMCFKDVSPFARDLFTFGAGKYTDAFNWHSYEPPESYEQILSCYRQDCHLGGMPTWLTEAGIFLGTSPDGELSEDAAHQQCEYVPKSVARSLACGNTKHFFFILPYRNEGGACLGALRKDLTPNPSAVALSAAARVLGSCKYSRTVELEGITADKRRTHAVAMFFDSPTGGERVVTWADERCEVSIRIDGAVANRNIKALNMFGGPYIVDTGADRVSLQLGTQPAYILIPKLTPVPRQ